LDAVWTNANTCTTEMASSLITDLKILKSLLSSSMQESTPDLAPPIESFNASLVANLLSGLDLKLNFIQEPFAQDSATSLADEKALHPNAKPIVLARKPLEKGLTVAENVLKWGTGAINVDAGRIGLDANVNLSAKQKNFDAMVYGGNNETSSVPTYNAQGRWPANVLFDEEAAEALDEQSGDRKGFSGGGTKGAGYRTEYVNGENKNKTLPAQTFNDSGGASRFFYVAKASKRERSAGLKGMPTKSQGAYGEFAGDGRGRQTEHQPTANFHPTVKPLKLMEYLIKLITPPNGKVLDPFMGSGSTGCAALRLGFGFVGIEREKEYLEIAKCRIEHASKEPKKQELGA
jgi:site-specific DNA-methyltransferase (adenine-specific)